MLYDICYKYLRLSNLTEIFFFYLRSLLIFIEYLRIILSNIR